MELAIERAFAEDGNGLNLGNSGILAESFFFVKKQNRPFKVKIGDIKWVQVEDKYCILNTENIPYTLRMSLRDLTEKLDPSIFVQTHRSYLVNIDAIDHINPQTFVVNIGSTEIPLGKSFKDDLLKRLHIL